MPAEVTAAVATAAMGLLAVIIAKSKCFCRNIDDEGWQYDVAFSDKAIIPDNGRFKTVELNSDVLMFFNSRCAAQSHQI